MSDSFHPADRRTFLKTVAAAGAASTAAPAETASAPHSHPTVASAAAIPYPRTFTGRQLQMLAFPLGGIAAGSISLGGRGQLRDWEIFNRADKGRSPSYAFPSLWVQMGKSLPVARVLEARLMPPYQAAEGLGPANAPGLQRMASAVFTGEYPRASIAFRDPKVPVNVALEAFTPILPLEAEESGLPVAVLRYTVKNPGRERAFVSIAYSIDNPAGTEPNRANERRSAPELEGLIMHAPELAADNPMKGSFALGVLGAGNGQVTILRGWSKAKWWASPLLFWDDFSSDGELGPEADQRNATGSVCLKREIGAGGTATFTFLLAWRFPNRTPAGCGWSAPKGEENAIIGNHYCVRFADAWAAAEYAALHLPALEERMRAFLHVMRETTLPPVLKEAAMSNLSTLATNTCFRTADGKFRGFEGTFDQRGCCHGTCTHVWNYESSTNFLFPELARSMRETAFGLSEKLDGVLPIRLQLPQGKQTGGTTAADGTMGQIVKTYLDWQLSGDDAWLRAMWPKVKHALEFAWVPGGWDANRDGVMEGVQHNTYDVEFYGPNPMCGIYYLAGLRAGEEMARAMGEEASAAEYRRLFQNGSKWIDANLFNGEFYIQKIQGIPQDRIAPPLRSTGGAEDTKHPDFQLGEGCLVDQLVGQYVADYCGLGPLVDPAKIRKTLESIYKYNYKRNLYEHESVQRIFALNDEAAMVICSYGAGRRPRIPFPYFAEVMTGFEYSAAVLMLTHGMVNQGVECIANIRRRYDGERRNAWDEAECGHHYARAMAAWSGIVMLSGFRYHGPSQRIWVMPRYQPERFTSFFSTAKAWGGLTHTSQPAGARLVLAPRFGKLAVAAVELRAPGTRASSVVLNGKPVKHSGERNGKSVTVKLAQAVELTERDELTIVV